MDCRSVHMAFSMEKTEGQMYKIPYIVFKIVLFFKDLFLFLPTINEIISLTPQSIHQVVLYTLTGYFIRHQSDEDTHILLKSKRVQEQKWNKAKRKSAHQKGHSDLTFVKSEEGQLCPKHHFSLGFLY